MLRRTQRPTNTALFTLLTAAATVSAASCSDEADSTSVQAGASGDAGSAGSGNSGGSAGSAAGGTGGSGGSGGSDAFAPVREVFDGVIDEANDLRGLTFAAEGGKIYASGYRGASYGSGASAVVPLDREVVVARFNADGSLDDTFGSDGIAAFNLVPRETEVVGGADAGADAGGEQVVLNDGNEESLSLVELPNGNLMVAVNLRGQTGAGQDVGLLELDSAGAPVAAFGSDRGVDGLRVIDFGWTDADNASWPGDGSPSDTAWDVKLDPAGDKVVLAGYGSAKLGELDGDGQQRTDNDRYIVRVMVADGSIDPGFNGGEVFRYNSLGELSDNGRRVLVEDDGAILSAGYANFGEGLGNHIVLIRLLPDGTLDPDFGFGVDGGGDGVARANPFVEDGGVAECYAVVQQESGRYVTTGYGAATGDDITSSYGFATSTAQDLVSFGVLPGGIDPTYGIEGAMAVQSEEANLAGTEDRGRDLIVLPDQRLVHAGRFGDAPALIVLRPDGELDTAVGTAGRFMYDPLNFAATADLPASGTSHFFNIALSPDGKRIAATTNNHPNGALLAILEVEE